MTAALSALASRGVRAAFALVAAAAIVALLVGLVLSLFADSLEEEMADIEEVALGYGESDGAEACDFLSASAIDQLGGDSGCTRAFESVPPAEFDVQRVTVEGEEGTAEVENVESEMVIDLGFVEEDGDWKIASFPGLDTLAPAAPGGTTLPPGGLLPPGGGPPPPGGAPPGGLPPEALPPPGELPGTPPGGGGGGSGGGDSGGDAPGG